MPYFRMGVHTIIGAGRFHFRGRDGIGWFPPAMAARQFVAGPFSGFPRGPALPRHGPKAAPRGIRTPPQAKAGARMPMQSKKSKPAFAKRLEGFARPSRAAWVLYGQASRAISIG